MKTTVRHNIDMVLLNIRPGVEEYYLPQNVAWAGKTVDRLQVFAPGAAQLSPVDDATPVMQRSQMDDLFVTLYNDKDQEIMHDVCAANLVHTANYPIEIHSRLNLSLCRVRFSQAPEDAQVLMLMVYYDSIEVEQYEPSKCNIYTEIPLGANEQISFRSIINDYVRAIPAKVRSLSFYDADSNPAYLILRDRALATNLRYVPTQVARPTTAGIDAEHTQLHPLLLDDINIDFDYSTLQNATSSPVTVKMLIEY